MQSISSGQTGIRRGLAACNKGPATEKERQRNDGTPKMKRAEKEEAKRPNLAGIPRPKMAKQITQRTNSAREAPSINMPMHSLSHS